MSQNKVKCSLDCLMSPARVQLGTVRLPEYLPELRLRDVFLQTVTVISTKTHVLRLPVLANKVNRIQKRKRCKMHERIWYFKYRSSGHAISCQRSSSLCYLFSFVNYTLGSFPLVSHNSAQSTFQLHKIWPLTVACDQQYVALMFSIFCLSHQLSAVY